MGRFSEILVDGCREFQTVRTGRETVRETEGVMTNGAKSIGTRNILPHQDFLSFNFDHEGH